jgi:hypothetical protein
MYSSLERRREGPHVAAIILDRAMYVESPFLTTFLV